MMQSANQAQAEPDAFDAASPVAPSVFRRFARDFVASPSATLGAAIVVLLVLLAVFAPAIAPQNPFDLASLNMFDNRLPPLSRGGDGFIYWLGSDGQGRDILSALLYGMRISLFVGIVSIGSAAAIGSMVGLTAAYSGGWIDALLMRIVDIQLTIPPVLVGVVLLSALGTGVDKVIVAIIAVKFAVYARLVRASALIERRKEYVEAAECLALPRLTIQVGHLLPNCLAPVLVVATVQVASAISLEATLSFLGVGVPVSEPSLGLLISQGFGYMMSGEYWVTIFPGLALFLIICGINLVGDHVRDILNPRLAK
jgi:peptide/nickel transport system permease protein